MSYLAFRKAFITTIPVLFGYLAIGIPFGLMVVQAGYPWPLAPLMSLVMFAGAGQYIAIGLFSAGVPCISILITILMVNIRHIVYGLSLLEAFKDTGKWKPYLIFSLTDETYALVTGVKVPPETSKGKFYATIALLDHLYWFTGTCIGAFAGSIIPFSFTGIDFALTALFMVLLIDQFRKTKDLVPIIIGVCSSIIALVIFGPSNMLIASLSFAVALLILLRGKKRGTT